MCQAAEAVVIQVPSLLLPHQATKYLNIGQAVHPSIPSQLMHHQGVLAYQTLEDHQRQRILGTRVFVLDSLVLDQGIKL